MKRSLYCEGAQESLVPKTTFLRWIGSLFWNMSHCVQCVAFLSVKRRIMELADLLSEHLVVFLEASSRDEAIDRLIQCLEGEHLLPEPAAFRTAIYHREELVSTGIGSGVAIPHARMAGYERFFLAIGIQKQGGLDWGAVDGVPVRLIFLIGGPEDRQAEYLQILSLLTGTIRDPEFRRKLLQTARTDEVVRLLGAGDAS